ncbi:MAG: division/cell wall cluster transcriptional repressor MraZ [Gammaproteobacteria bacterium]|nr:division/cell wall cluster transcriptional repressor MraZ [Gammaproteobacteria bacterium]
MFAGSHLLAIDDKGRVAVPARFRQQLSDDRGQLVYITRSYQPCLEVYPAPVFKEIADQIQADPDRRRADLLKQVFIGNAVETEIDKQGRVLLPQLLRKFARLNGSAMMVGQINRFDIWSEEQWNEKFGDGAGATEDLAAAFAALKR